MALHLIKLGVGVESVEHLERVWAGRERRTVHTRQSPRRGAELLDGGSLYWVIRSVLVCRQPIIDVRTVEDGPHPRCEVDLGLPVVRVEPQPRRPFQGWRYLSAEDAPRDLGAPGEGEALPTELALRLRALGAW